MERREVEKSGEKRRGDWTRKETIFSISPFIFTEDGDD